MIEQIRRFIIPAAYELLPSEMASDRATALLLTIGLQESRFQRRRQIAGPARGFWQFERNGVRAVLEHPSSRKPILHAIEGLCYDIEDDAGDLHPLLEHNDVLAACFARCLLWTLPTPLPASSEPANGWLQYFEGWRPGTPRRDTWDLHYAHAWNVTQSPLDV